MNCVLIPYVASHTLGKYLQKLVLFVMLVSHCHCCSLYMIVFQLLCSMVENCMCVAIIIGGVGDYNVNRSTGELV